MNQCTHCTVVPTPTPEFGILYIAPPLAHTSKIMSNLMRKVGLCPDTPAPNLLCVSLAPGVLELLTECLTAGLSHAELRDTRTLVIEAGKVLTPADLAAMQSLATLVARARADWFTDMLRNNRLISHFQPIVPADNPAEIFAYECLLRGLESDGSIVGPARLFQTARDADLMFQLDQAARLTAVRSAAAHGLDRGDTRLFINFNPTSIYDPAYCLRSTIAVIGETNLRPEQIVFEIVESDQIDDLNHLVKISDFYRDAGFGVALDDLGAGYGSLNLLSVLKPDFAKLDMQLIRGVDHDSYKGGIVSKLLEMTRVLGVKTVAEGIETEAEWDWLRRQGADYVQGYLFAQPGSPPPRPRHPGKSWNRAARFPQVAM